MRTTHSKSLVGVPLFLALLAFMSGPLRADLKQTPLLLKKHGSYIEITEGVFRRCESIDVVKAVIGVRYVRDHRTLQTIQFPLNLKGLSDFKKLDRTKLEGAECRADVLIYINGAYHCLVASKGDDPIKDWDAFKTAATDALGQLNKLLDLASKSQQGGACQPATRPGTKSE